VPCFPDLLVLRFLAPAMLSTGFEYLRPAARARVLAWLFCFREREADVFFGFLRSMVDAIQTCGHLSLLFDGTPRVSVWTPWRVPLRFRAVATR
jgi:hypothetical protein